MKKSEKIALFDMDSSLADFDASMETQLSAMASPGEPSVTESRDPTDWEADPLWLKVRQRMIKRVPGFWRDLPPIPFGIDLYHLLGELGYDRMVLTKGPFKNAQAWAEKVLWCQQHVPEAGITITEANRDSTNIRDKSLVYGRVLYDDYPPYILNWLEWRPRGRVLMLDARHNKQFTHPNVLRCTRESLASQRDSILSFLGAGA